MRIGGEKQFTEKVRRAAIEKCHAEIRRIESESSRAVKDLLAAADALKLVRTQADLERAWETAKLNYANGPTSEILEDRYVHDYREVCKGCGRKEFGGVSWQFPEGYRFYCMRNSCDRAWKRDEAASHKKAPRWWAKHDAEQAEIRRHRRHPLAYWKRRSPWRRNQVKKRRR